VYRLLNPVRNYRWGSPTVLPDLLGVPADGKPQAELWIGAHVSAPSIAVGEDGQQTRLDELVRDDAVALLGAATVARFGDRLPFLLKVLAAEQALSLQVHPDAARAARRFAAEEEAGVPLSAPDRLYKDAYHKPELVYALTRFDVLSGFRPPSESAGLLRLLRKRGACHPVLDAVIADLDRHEGDDALRAATELLLTLPSPEGQSLVEVITAACRGADDPAMATAADLGLQFPADPGVVVSLLLNRVRLEPGQALFLAAGNVHAYLHGTAIEVMASSDNVLRGGLTDKHIDVPELLEVIDFRALPVPWVTPTLDGNGEEVFAPPTPDFQLSVNRLSRHPRGPHPEWDDERPRAVLVLEGEVILQGTAETQRVERGQSVFVPVSDLPVAVVGDGTMVTATTGGNA